MQKRVIELELPPPFARLGPVLLYLSAKLKKVLLMPIFQSRYFGETSILQGGRFCLMPITQRIACRR